MPKIIFALKPSYFYENLAHRRSYISVIDGNVIQTKNEMLKNQKEYFDNIFPTDENLFSEFLNFEYTNLHTRKVNIMTTRDLPHDVYPQDFNFWQNINYAKIVYNNGFTEYFYIKDRKLKNLAVNLWEFTFVIDIWNTYWIDIYQEYLLNSKLTLKPVHVIRAHKDRFVLYNYPYDKTDISKTLPFFIFEFLYTQNSPFWNKEKIEQTVNNFYISETVKSFQPWNDETLPNYDKLRLYGINDENVDLFGQSSGFLTAFVISRSDTTPNAGGFNLLDSWYGCINTYYVIPLINKKVLGEATYQFNNLNVIEMFEEPGTSYSYQGNVLDNILGSPFLSTIIQTPKPIWPYLNRSGTWNDWTYPIRYRGRYIENNLSVFDAEAQITPEPLLLPLIAHSLVTISIVAGKREQWKTTDEMENNIKSLENTLCDERIPADEVCDLLHFKINKYKKRQSKIIELEPKIYDDNLTLIKFNHFNGKTLNISLRWYFFNNFDDLIYWKSIFIQGYQFVQPHITALFQWPSSGLYENATISGTNNVLVSFFSPNMQIVGDNQERFLVNNRSQLNAALNTQWSKSGIGIAENVFGGIAGVARGVENMDVIGSISSFFSGIFGGVKSAANYEYAQNQYKALIEDLGNSPSTVSDPVNESTFKMLNSYVSYAQTQRVTSFNQLSLWTYHAEKGYLVNVLEYVSTFATRIYYNFWQFVNFKLFLSDLNINADYKEYFEKLFEKGITLWHDCVIDGDKYNEVGLYDYENWETKFYNVIGNSFGIKIDSTKSVTLSTSTYVEIINYKDLINLKVTIVQQPKTCYLKAVYVKGKKRYYLEVKNVIADDLAIIKIYALNATDLEVTINIKK